MQIAICGWDSSETTQKIIDEMIANSIQIRWGIFSAESIDSIRNKIGTTFTEAEIYKDICGVKTNNGFKWQLTLTDLKAYDKYLSILLRVQERWLIGNWNIDDRIFLIHNAINYFYSILTQDDLKVQAIVHSTASPHHFYNTVLTSVANELGIPSLFFNQSFISNRCNIVDGFNKRFIWCRGYGDGLNHYNEYLKSFDNEDFTPTYIKNYFRISSRSLILFFLLIYPKLIARNLYASVVKKEMGLYLYNGRVGIEAGLQKSIDQLKSAMALFSLKKLYFKHAVDDIEQGAIIFYGSYQPEATSHPDGGDYPDIRYLVSHLSLEGKAIYYKEHPTMFNYENGGWLSDFMRHRSWMYYQNLLNKGVKLINPYVSNRKLLSKASAVVTISGTIALEAAIMGVDSYVVGYPWYGNLPGIEKIDLNFKGLPMCLHSNREQILRYLETLDLSSGENIFGVATGVRNMVKDNEIRQFVKYICTVLNTLTQNNNAYKA